MRNLPLFFAMLLCAWSHTPLCAQQSEGATARPARFPDIPQYQTLLCDLHQHTVFSDGEVWPTIRVKEALADGLDVIALTDHLEWRPHEDDIPFPDSNRPWEIALEKAGDSGLIVLNGGEVTRDLPPGHTNAVFVKDVNRLLLDEPLEVFREAKRQDAFIFWNHPHWIAQKPDGLAEITPLHLQMIEEGMLHGIEIVNQFSFSDEALAIALEHNLTILGNSDVHGLVDWDYKVHSGGHRPFTLLFAKEKSEAAVREALFAGRTAVVFNDTLIGRTEYVAPLVEQCVTIEEAHILESYMGPSLVISALFTNHSSIDFIFENRSEYSLHNAADIITIPAGGSVAVQIKVGKPTASVSIPFRVLNAVTAPRTHPVLAYRLVIPEWAE